MNIIKRILNILLTALKIVALGLLAAAGIALVCLVIYLTILTIVWYTPKKVAVTQNPVIIQEQGYHPANNCQSLSDVWLHPYDGNLYFYGFPSDGRHATKYTYWLSSFHDGEVNKVFKMDASGLSRFICAAASGRYLYYWGLNNENLYCFDLETKKEILLWENCYRIEKDLVFTAEDGTVYFAVGMNEDYSPQYIHVQGTEIIEQTNRAEWYSFGGKRYYAGLIKKGIIRLFAEDEKGEVETLPFGINGFETDLYYSLIPTDYGVLVYISTSGVPLYLLNEEGQKQLVNFGGIWTQTGMNIHGSDVYISVYSYTDFNHGFIHQDGNEVDGTYRISLEDGSVEKINDLCFVGIFNFDDTCFYCTDRDCNIYRMDFDGNITEVLYQVLVDDGINSGKF